MEPRTLTRRTFLVSTALGVTGCAVAPRRHVVSSRADKLNIACIGCGGKGAGDVSDCAGEHIVALCDVDENLAAGIYQRYPDVPKYRDYRVMLDKHPEIDAVTVSTADHSHAPAAMAAMQLGKHVFVQKPMTHTVYEARALREAAAYYGVATQMGNQGHSYNDIRELCEMLWTGAIGSVREVHCGTDRPWWPQNVDRPSEGMQVPDNLSWDLWLGPAPWRPYNSCYHPFNWRGWWDFGTGALGDMGCHILDPVVTALKLHTVYPTAVEVVEAEGGNEETPPSASIVRYDFPRRGKMPPVKVFWYDGRKQPPIPPGLGPDDRLGDNNANGSLFIGDDGLLTAGTYGGNPRLLPEAKMRDYRRPEPFLPRSPGSMQEWFNACRGGQPAGANFDYAGKLTELVLLGNIALRAKSRIEYDGRTMRVTNHPDANRFLTKEYREGFDFFTRWRA